MRITLAFDVYGTLIDTTAVACELEKNIGERAGILSQAWREKQLEYSFRRGLMRNYRDFSVCTRQALDYVCQRLKINLAPQVKDELMALYRVLPAYPDVMECLPMLKRAGIRMFAFSNGRAAEVAGLLEHANIAGYFEGVVSTDPLCSFKPDPAVYAYFLRQSGSCSDTSWLVSGNSFDVIGAISAGMRGVWVNRTGEGIFDPWEIEPSRTIINLNEINRLLEETAI